MSNAEITLIDKSHKQWERKLNLHKITESIGFLNQIKILKLNFLRSISVFPGKMRPNGFFMLSVIRVHASLTLMWLYSVFNCTKVPKPLKSIEIDALMNYLHRAILTKNEFEQNAI